jgi:TetR/AcrR family transcriptional regulator, transcriptional repressor for nem operon
MADVKHFDPATALERVEELFWRNGVASTSIQDVASTTGLNRSSLYATFGGKRELYLAALRRYVQLRAEPAARVLAEAGDGLAAIGAFFAGLIEVRTSGPFAGWGCMIVNAHTSAEGNDPEVRALLDGYHRTLCDAFVAALRRSALKPTTDIEATAELLALLAYGVNLRSRAGEPAATLLRTTSAALAPLQPQAP